MGCLIAHEAVKRSEVMWSALPFVGIQPDGDGFLELRNCMCGSTLAREVDDGPHPLDAHPIPPDVFRAAGAI